jgi:hypothetical protein
MCRNIKVLFNFDPPATQEEIRNAAHQFVRKVSGSMKPTNSNEMAFNLAVDEISKSVENLLNTMVTAAKPKNRAVELLKSKTRSARRFGTTQKQRNT